MAWWWLVFTWNKMWERTRWIIVGRFPKMRDCKTKSDWLKANPDLCLCKGQESRCWLEFTSEFTVHTEAALKVQSLDSLKVWYSNYRCWWRAGRMCLTFSASLQATQSYFGDKDCDCAEILLWMHQEKVCKSYFTYQCFFVCLFCFVLFLSWEWVKGNLSFWLDCVLFWSWKYKQAKLLARVFHISKHDRLLFIFTHYRSNLQCRLSAVFPPAGLGVPLQPLPFQTDGLLKL